MSGVRRVIVGVSDSPGSLQAVRYAAELARSHDAVLIPVLAWQPPGGDFGDRSYPSAHLRQLWRDATAKRLRQALGLAIGGIPDDLSCDPRTVRGAAGPVLVGVAALDGDVLVIGAGRRGGLTRFAACRVARYCLARASCPVVAVPPPELIQLGRGLRGWAWRHRGLSRDERAGLSVGG